MGDITEEPPASEDGDDDDVNHLAVAILRELAAAPGEGGMSLPRLGKRLDVGVSVLMRQLSPMGDAVIGGIAGPGWVRVTRLDDRWVAALTETGRAFCAEHLPPEDASSADTPG